MTTLNFTFEQEHYLTQTAKSLGMSLENFILAKVNYKATPKATMLNNQKTDSQKINNQEINSQQPTSLANRLVLMDDLIEPIDDNVWEVD